MIADFIASDVGNPLATSSSTTMVLSELEQQRLGAQPNDKNRMMMNRRAQTDDNEDPCTDKSTCEDCAQDVNVEGIEHKVCWWENDECTLRDAAGHDTSTMCSATPCGPVSTCEECKTRSAGIDAKICWWEEGKGCNVVDKEGHDIETLCGSVKAEGAGDDPCATVTDCEACGAKTETLDNVDGKICLWSDGKCSLSNEDGHDKDTMCAAKNDSTASPTKSPVDSPAKVDVATEAPTKSPAVAPKTDQPTTPPSRAPVEPPTPAASPGGQTVPTPSQNDTSLPPVAPGVSPGVNDDLANSSFGLAWKGGLAFLLVGGFVVFRIRRASSPMVMSGVQQSYPRASQYQGL